MLLGARLVAPEDEEQEDGRGQSRRCSAQREAAEPSPLRLLRRRSFSLSIVAAIRRPSSGGGTGADSNRAGSA